MPCLHYRKGVAIVTVALGLLAGCSSTPDDISTQAPEQVTTIAAPADVNQAGEAVTLAVVDGGETTGLVVTNHLGFAVYGVLGETPDSLVCIDDCVNVWVPVPPRSGSVADELDPSLLGTIARPDGIAQATYNDVPLYTWSRDNAIGITGGAGVAGTWYALTEAGGFVAAPQ